MLLNDLFIIDQTKQVEDHIFAEIRLHANHRIFDGHFPGSPVLPAVVQLQMIKEILGQHLQMKLHVKSMRSCKFLSVINPVEMPLISFSIKYVQQEFLEVTVLGVAHKMTFLKAQISYC